MGKYILHTWIYHKQLVGGGDDDDANLSVAEDGELMGFLKETHPPLREGYLTR